MDYTNVGDIQNLEKSSFSGMMGSKPDKSERTGVKKEQDQRQ